VGTAYRERVSWLVSAVYISLSLSLSWTLLIGLPSFLLPFYLWFETKMFFIFAKTKTSENYVLFAKFRSEKIIFQTFSFCECFREKKFCFTQKVLFSRQYSRKHLVWHISTISFHRNFYFSKKRISFLRNFRENRKRTFLFQL
jgi:hypothetical protein